MAFQEASDTTKRHVLVLATVRLLPGIAVAGVVALAAFGTSATLGGPAPMHAMVGGLLLSPLVSRFDVNAGLDLCTGALLKIAIALLGTRIAFGEMLDIGLMPIMMIAFSIGIGLAGSAWVARRCGLGLEFGLIAGAAVSICGVSAALAAASLFRQSPSLKRDTLFVALSVTLLSTVAMVIYPWLTRWLQFDAAQSGLFLGATIHDLAQVVGAGYGLSTSTGDAAVLTKLVRVGLLAPAIGAAAMIAHSRKSPSLKLDFPWFIAFFAIAVLWHTAGLIPPLFLQASNVTSGAVLLMAIAAIALKTQWKTLHEGNWRQFALILVHTLVLAAVVATLVSLAH